MKKFLLGTLGLVAMVAPAFAADLPVKAPPPPIIPIFNWSGFYIGGNAGWGRSDSCANFFDGFDNSFLFFDPCNNRSGGLLGGQIGYRWQMPGNHFVFGVEVAPPPQRQVGLDQRERVCLVHEPAGQYALHGRVLLS